VICCHQWTKI